MQQRFLVFFLFFVLFWGAGAGEAQVCRDAAGGVIPCPATEVPEQADSDGDGMIDSLDRCPTEGGPAQNTGCPEGTTVTEEAPTAIPQAILPTAGACVMATNGTEAVNRRDIPSSQGTVVGIIQPSEIFPINFSVSTSEGLWYNTSPFSWVLASVVRLGGDCSRLPSASVPAGSLLPDFSAWEADECNPAENPRCGSPTRVRLITSVPYPDPLAEVEEDEDFVIIIALFVPDDGGLGLMITNRPPDTFPNPDDDGDNPAPYFIDFDLVDYEPGDDPLPPDLPILQIPIMSTPDHLWLGPPLSIENGGTGGSTVPPFEPILDIANPEDDIDIIGETVLENIPLNDGCDLYEAQTYYHDFEDIGKTYQAYLGSVNGYTMLEGSQVTAWIDSFGISYSTQSELKITRPYLEQLEFITSISGPGDFFELNMDELGNYLTTFDVTVSSWTNSQPNKFRLNICLRYPEN